MIYSQPIPHTPPEMPGRRMPPPPFPDNDRDEPQPEIIRRGPPRRPGFPGRNIPPKTPEPPSPYIN